MNNRSVRDFSSFIKDADPGNENQLIGSRSHMSVLAVLAVLCAMGVYYYGTRAAAVAGVCLISSWTADAVCLIIRRRHLHFDDISSLITGLSIACLLPASVPYTTAAAACIFAICIAKHPFGGRGCEIICPAAAGYIFAELSFKAEVTYYPRPFAPLSMSNNVQEQLYRAFSGGSSGDLSDLELLVGASPGTLGCTGAVTVIVCILVLIFTGSVPAGAVIPEIAVYSAYILIFSGTGGILRCPVDLFAAAILSSGGHVPQKNSSRVMFGIISGLLIIIISEISALNYPAVYAAVIAAPFAFLTDGRQAPERVDTQSREHVTESGEKSPDNK